MSDAHFDAAKTKKSFFAVGIALFVFTVVTVVVGLVPMFDIGAPGPDAADVILGLGIAGTKASLVALVFMHLNHEKGAIYKLLFFTTIMFACLMVATIFAEMDPIQEQFDTLSTTSGVVSEVR